jgi:hypothetical protein
MESATDAMSEWDRIASRCERGTISPRQAHPLGYLWETNSAFSDVYMSVYYLWDEGRPLENLDLLAFGDGMAALIQMVGLTLGEWAGNDELEKRFRRGRDWAGAASLVTQAFELMCSEQWPHQAEGGLCLDEVEEILENASESLS